LIVASVPVWMVLLSAAQERRRPSLAVLAGLVLALAGIALLVLPNGDGRAVELVPAGALLVAALSWSVGSLWSRRAPLPKATLLATAMEALAGGAALWIAGLVGGEGASLHLSAITARSALSLAYLIVAGSILGFSAYVWLLTVSTPDRVSTYAFVNPIVAVAFGVLLAGEKLTPRIALASAVIVGAVALILRFGSKRAPRTRPVPSPTAAEPVVE
jgi:drug/metabolite transporter (DMT)-like permease